MTFQELLKARDSIHVHFWAQQGWLIYTFAFLTLVVMGYAVKLYNIRFDKGKEFNKWYQHDRKKFIATAITIGMFMLIVIGSWADYQDEKNSQMNKWFHQEAIPYIQQHEQSYVMENYQCGYGLGGNVVNLTDDSDRVGVTVSFQDKNGQIKKLFGNVKVFKTKKLKPYVTTTYIPKDLANLGFGEEYNAGYYEPSLYIPQSMQFKCER